MASAGFGSGELDVAEAESEPVETAGCELDTLASSDFAGAGFALLATVSFTALTVVAVAVAPASLFAASDAEASRLSALSVAVTLPLASGCGFASAGGVPVSDFICD